MKQLSGKKSKQKAYYAHSKLTYDTKKERSEKRFLEKKFTVFDPNKDFGEQGTITPYLEQIVKCKCVVCSEYKGFVGRGVCDEILFALSLRKEVFCLRKKLGRYVLFPVSEVSIHDSFDWKVKYAKVVRA